MKLGTYVDLLLLEEMIEQRYVSEQKHPTEPLAILNYTQRTQFDRVWNDVTRKCRGLIYDYETGLIVARPWPKFFNYGEYEEGALDLAAPVRVTDKLDGSLGILYPEAGGHAIATRGSFVSEQALHATEVYIERYEQDALFDPLKDVTYLFEIVYPQNRVVLDYHGLDDLILLGIIDTETGQTPIDDDPAWPGPTVATFAYATLAEALAAEPRPNAEGLVVHFLDTDERVKLKQDDYVALHRILTGTNARNVWEVAAVRACADYIAEPKHWGTYLGIDPARAAECLVLGDDWLVSLPDEFHDWVRDTIREVEEEAAAKYGAALKIAEFAGQIASRSERYASISRHRMVTEIMRVASADGFEKTQGARNELWLRCWRDACPAPTAPFARSEAVA